MTNYETTNLMQIQFFCDSSGYWPGHARGDKSRIRIGGADFLPPEDLELMEWDEWYEHFQRRQLKFVYDPTQGWFDLQSRVVRAD